MTRFARVDLDSVAPLLPSNKVAARVAGRGEHFEFKAREGEIHSDLPIPFRAPTQRELMHPNFTDWTGTAVGRLRVMGIHETSTHEPRRWVVRCVCGCYEVRRSKFIKQRSEGLVSCDDAKCSWCNKTQKLQKGFGVVRDGPLVKAEDAR